MRVALYPSSIKRFFLDPAYPKSYFFEFVEYLPQIRGHDWNICKEQAIPFTEKLGFESKLYMSRITSYNVCYTKLLRMSGAENESA